MESYRKSKSALCCASGKKRRIEALRACDYCTTSIDERITCYKSVAKDVSARNKTCMMMQ
nr:hypothetical protein [uncultured Desulfobacter sp.]